MYPIWPMTQAAKKPQPAARTAHTPAEEPTSGRRTQVRESGIHGKGVYAIRPIKAGDTVRLANGMKARVTSVIEGADFTIDANPPLAGTSGVLDIELLHRKSVGASYSDVVRIALGADASETRRVVGFCGSKMMVNKMIHAALGSVCKKRTGEG